MFFEDNTFEIMELENDILYESIHLDILKFSIMEDVYTENEDGFLNKIKNFIDNIIEKIKKFFINAKEAITNFFTRKKVDDKLEEIKEAIKENPELAKEQVTIPDHSGLDKLYKDTINVLKDNSEATTKAMERYKKERDAFIKGTVVLATTTVGLGTALGIITDLKDNKIHELEMQRNKAKSICDKRKTEIKNLENTIDKLRTDISDKSKEITEKNRIIRDQESEINIANTNSPIKRATFKVKKTINQVNDKKDDLTKSINDKKDNAVAVASVAHDAIQSSISTITGTFNAIANYKKSPMKSIRGAINKIGDTANDVVSGKAFRNAKDQQIQSREVMIETYGKKINQLNEILSKGVFKKHPKEYYEDELVRYTKKKEKLEKR